MASPTKEGKGHQFWCISSHLKTSQNINALEPYPYLYSDRWQFTVVLRAVIYRQVIGQSFLTIQQVILTYINNTIRTHNQHTHHNQPNQKHNGTGNEVMWDDVSSE